MANEKPKPRGADVLAGEGSILDKIRRRRIATEDMLNPEDEKPTNEDHKRGYTKQAWEE